MEEAFHETSNLFQGDDEFMEEEEEWNSKSEFQTVSSKKRKKKNFNSRRNKKKNSMAFTSFGSNIVHEMSIDNNTEKDDISKKGIDPSILFREEGKKINITFSRDSIGYSPRSSDVGVIFCGKESIARGNHKSKNGKKKKKISNNNNLDTVPPPVDGCISKKSIVRAAFIGMLNYCYHHRDKKEGLFDDNDLLSLDNIIIKKEFILPFDPSTIDIQPNGMSFEVLDPVSMVDIILECMKSFSKPRDIQRWVNYNIRMKDITFQRLRKMTASNMDEQDIKMWRSFQVYTVFYSFRIIILLKTNMNIKKTGFTKKIIRWSYQVLSS
jgi:hypothetical protein